MPRAATRSGPCNGVPDLVLDKSGVSLRRRDVEADQVPAVDRAMLPAKAIQKLGGDGPGDALGLFVVADVGRPAGPRPWPRPEIAPQIRRRSRPHRRSGPWPPTSRGVGQAIGFLEDNEARLGTAVRIVFSDKQIAGARESFCVLDSSLFCHSLHPCFGVESPGRQVGSVEPQPGAARAQSSPTQSSTSPGSPIGRPRPPTWRCMATAAFCGSPVRRATSRSAAPGQLLQVVFGAAGRDDGPVAKLERLPDLVEKRVIRDAQDGGVEFVVQSDHFLGSCSSAAQIIFSSMPCSDSTSSGVSREAASRAARASSEARTA